MCCLQVVWWGTAADLISNRPDGNIACPLVQFWNLGLEPGCSEYMTKSQIPVVLFIRCDVQSSSGGLLLFSEYS